MTVGGACTGPPLAAHVSFSVRLRAPWHPACWESDTVRRTKDPIAAQSHEVAWKLALGFLLAGAAWVIVTDILVYRFVEDPIEIARLETAKGWAFIALAAGAGYFVASHAVRKIARSNATLGAIVTSISDDVLVLDRQGAVRVANPAAARILGMDPEDLVGMDGPEFARRFHVSLPDGRVIDPERYVSQRALTGECPPPYKAVIHPPGRDDVVAIVTGSPVRLVPEGPVVFAVSVIHDVTAIENLQKMRDEFLASAAHTLRTPIAIISAQAHLLSAGLARSPQASTDAIERQCRRLTRVTENLFVLARLRSESLQLHPEPVPLADVVAGAIDAMQHATDGHRIAAHVRTKPVVFADRERIELVIRNMIELAMRRSPPGAVLAVELDEVADAGRVAIAYQRLDHAEVVDDQTGLEGLGLERHVNIELVAATNGRFGSEHAGVRQVDWIEVPKVEPCNA
jgi:PAS domain S-box-containing protein